MLTRVALGIMWLLRFLPLSILAVIGSSLGMVLYWVARERRDVVRINLQLCFPNWSVGQREAIARAHFRALTRGFLESSVAWWGSPDHIRRVARIEGEEHLRPLGERRVIFLVPHFVGIELEGVRMALDYRGMAVYVHQKNKVFDKFLLRVRTRFPGGRMISRQEGVKSILRGFKEGWGLQLSPDLDLGERDAVFVPFFNQQAATVTALARLCKLTGAAVIPVVVRQLPGGGGYNLKMYPVWDNYPSDSVEDDTRRMNAFIEARVLEMPEQYYWVHKRFKTRPNGEAKPY